MGDPSRGELLEACRVLFDGEFDPSFLGVLQVTGLRSAWRRQALRTHPDRAACCRGTADADAGSFLEARRAYDLLLEFLSGRGTPSPPPAGSRPAAAQRRRAGRQRRPLPRRPLLLGEFLYRERLIPYASLIEALVWQRSQRERFCEIAVRWGLLSETGARRLLATRRPHEPAGVAARRLGLLSAFQVGTVLRFQRSRQRPIGGYFVERGLLSRGDVEALVRRLERHNAACLPG